MPSRLPAQGTTGVPLLDTLVGLGAGVSGLSAGTLLVYASAATGAYAVWEQMRFRMARCAEEGAGCGRGAWQLILRHRWHNGGGCWVTSFPARSAGHSEARRVSG